MPVRERRPGDERPLIRAVNEQVLVRPVGGEHEEQEEPRGAQAEETQAQEAQAAFQAEGASQGEKGPIARAMDKAQENNWVYGSVAQRVRETGLLDKADAVLHKVKNTLTGK